MGSKIKLDLKKLKIQLARESINIMGLSEKSGINISTLYSYSSGKRDPGTKAIGKIANALNVDVTEIIA